MGKSAPRAPNPSRTAAAQSAANREAIQESARVSAVDQFAPWGSTTYQRDEAGVPTSQTIEFGPEEQAAYESQRDITGGLFDLGRGRVQQLPGEAFSLEGLPSGDRVANTLYQRKLGLVQPQLDEAKKDLEIRLTERGIPVGSEIYNDEMGRFERARSQTLEALSQDAVLAGGAEEDRLLNRALAERGQNINELSAIMQGAPAISSPQFQSTPAYQVAAPDIAGLTQADYANRLNAYNQQQGNLYGGLFSLGTALL